MLKAEIIAVGDELCYGRIYDKNSFWIADQLTQLGVMAQRITCIRDDSDKICNVLKEAVNRKPAFIFITGGLGPTEDDKTMEGLMKLTGRNVIIDQNILSIIAKKRKAFQGPLKPGHYKMTSTLEGAECLPNPVGWAPLTILRLIETTIFVLPGPPREMQACFNKYISSEVQKVSNYHSITKRLIVTMFESEITPLINEVLKTIREAYIKPLVSEYDPTLGLPIEVVIFGMNEEACQKNYEHTLSLLTNLVNQKGKQLRIVQ
jgi:molybdenum cofactor synthesis domain-containing protein